MPRHCRTLLHCASAIGLALCSAGRGTPASGSQRYVDDFSVPSLSWRYGSEIRKADAEGLVLSGRAPEATLAGTAVHPENMGGFTATFRWNFGGKEKRSLWLGWGKPFEYSAFGECAERLAIGADGELTVFAGGKQIGTGRIAVSNEGDASITIRRGPDSLVLLVDGKETAFPFPPGERTAAGYFALRTTGIDQNTPPLHLQRVEIQCDGDRPPLTEEQRTAENQRWAGLKLHGNSEVLVKFEQYLATETAAGLWGFTTDMNVEPGLVKQGETVRLTFRCTGPLPTRCEALLEPDYLGGSGGGTKPLALKWRESGGAHEATIELKPTQCGNWKIVWQVDDEQLSRVFGVVDRGYSVCRFLVTNDRALTKPNPEPAAHDAIHDAGLPADYWGGSEWTSPFSRTPESLVEHFKKRADMRHRWGDRLIPLCNANLIIPGCPDNNLFRLSDEVQVEGLRQLSRLWDLLGFGPLDVLGSYTLGHSTPRLARSIGVKMIDSLCQWQNWLDGGDANGWLINDWGAPTVPYFVADDDFRKVAPGRSIVAFTQTTTSNVRAFCIFTAEGQPQLSSMRRSHGTAMPETENIDRFETTFDFLLDEASHQDEPLFLSIGLENFVDSPDWNEANRRGVQYLVRQARTEKLVFASAADIAGYFQRHYEQQPENWFYWPDIYAGYTHQYSWKPLLLPDRIELSNTRFHSLHEDGAVLPRFFWDFTHPWAEPVWDDQTPIRQKFGLVTPDLLTADNCVPRMVDLTGVTAAVTIEPQSSGIIIRARVDSPRDLDALPLGLWRIPLRLERCEVAEASEGARFVKVVDGSTGNLHGVLVCDHVTKGSHTWTLRLRGEVCAPVEPEFRVGDDVRGRSFQRASGATTTYVWLENASRRTGTLTVRVPAGRQAGVHYNDGLLEEARDGVLRITLDRSWQHESPMITGLTAAEIRADAEFQPATVQP